MSFLDELHASYDRIVKGPLKYRELRSGIRRALFRRFPYSAYFAVEGDVIVVLAVLHASRDPADEVREEAADLFALDRRRAAGVPQLIERLRARLGTEAVQGVCLGAEHRPESAWRVAEPGRCQWWDPSDPTSNPTDPTTGTSAPSARPLWLLTEPQPLAGDEQPRYEGALELEAGPERIESGWWDGHDVKRDYYVARTAAGMRLWVFRERVAMGRWFLHGVFG